MKQIHWIPEVQAAEMIGRKPETLRKRAKAAVWPIAWSAVQGRRYRYSKADIEKLLLTHSNNSSFK